MKFYADASLEVGYNGKEFNGCPTPFFELERQGKQVNYIIDSVKGYYK
jgi:hypothetical protein